MKFGIHPFRLIRQFFLLLVAGWMLLSCEQESLIPAPDARGIISGLSYGEDPRQNLDIVLPANRTENTPVVFLLHGGAWTTGNKGLEYIRGMRTAFADTGIAAVSMNYRYGNGNFQNQMDDIREALNLVSENAADWGISGDKFGLWGFEAGAHLSLLYGHAFQDARVRTVISLAGATDLADTALHSALTAKNLMDDLRTFMGGGPVADSLNYYLASPLYFLSPIPTLLIHGGTDQFIPVEQSIAFYDALNGLGGRADTTIFPSKGHNLFKGDADESLLRFQSQAWMSFYLNF